jgi:hypothetical protein
VIVHRCKQGTPEWLALRAGIPTSSKFDKIITPEGKVSTQAEKYAYELLAERLTGESTVDYLSEWMIRGKMFEPHAAAWYQKQVGADLDMTEVGFITNDAGTIGASPDRLVGDEGLLEIKCPKDSTHVGYLLEQDHAKRYRPQIQGQLWISERAWLDMLSYHPRMPQALVRVERDDKYIKLLSTIVPAFVAQLKDLEARIR